MVEMMDNTYNLEVEMKEVSEWTKDGEGAYLHSAEINMEKDFYAKELTLENIAKIISELMSIDITVENLSVGCEKMGTFDIIENGDGEQDNDGSYLCMYTFTITPIAEALDLESLFANEGNLYR